MNYLNRKIAILFKERKNQRKKFCELLAKLKEHYQE